MKNIKLLTIFSVASLAYFGCSESSHTTSSPMNNGEGEFAEGSFSSSSGLTNRADIEYHRNVEMNETVNYYIESPKIDEANPEAEIHCSEESICLTAGENEVHLFLGEFDVGTRILVSAATSGMSEDSVYVMSEMGEVLKPIKPNCTSDEQGNENCLYENYMKAGDGAELVDNEFAVFNKGFFYIKLKGNFSVKSHMRLFARALGKYYKYTGETEKVSIALDDTLRGIVKLGEDPAALDISFGANKGKSVTLNAQGSWITAFSLLANKDEIFKNDGSSLNEILLPQDTTLWKLTLTPQSIPDFQSGPYALFTIATKSRNLNQGEYLAKPDSVKKVGEPAIHSFDKIDDFEIRFDHYTWLGNFKKGETISVSQSYKGYIDRETAPFTEKEYVLVKKDGTILKELKLDDYSYKVAEDGPIYFHFTVKNSRSSPESRKLEISTQVDKL